MNKNGHPGTLVPAHPGNTNAARYGVYSRRLIEPRAREILRRHDIEHIAQIAEEGCLVGNALDVPVRMDLAVHEVALAEASTQGDASP